MEDDGQAQAGSAFPDMELAAFLLKGPAQPFLKFFAHSDTVILNDKAEERRVRPRAFLLGDIKGKMPFRRGVFDGINEYVDQNLIQARPVAHKGIMDQSVNMDGKGMPFAFRLRLRAYDAGNVGYKAGKTEGFCIES